MPCKCIPSIYIYPGIELESVVWRSKEGIENLWSSAHVVHLTAKQIISRRRKDENGCEMYKNEKYTHNMQSDSFSLLNI